MSYDVVLLLAEASDDAGVTPPPPRTALADAIEHARDWLDAAKAVRAAKAAWTIADELPSPERLMPFVAKVAAAAKKRKCVAIWWKPAARLVAPEVLAAAAKEDDPLRVALQVRLFHVETGVKDEHVVDTVGLDALGLPDVQCHFIGLDPQLAGTVVATAARYVFDEGDVIGEGDTIDAPDGGAWTCRREESLLAPAREVIDLAPPKPHAAR
ncbi:MAG TPA: DUF4261 domain-containing protein [Polyangia bacterium]|jgi:hypothetical protein|nr:DUF4261 domain-containing protein [Polyangia bacterium]